MFSCLDFGLEGDKFCILLREWAFVEVRKYRFAFNSLITLKVDFMMNRKLSLLTLHIKHAKLVPKVLAGLLKRLLINSIMAF